MLNLLSWSLNRKGYKVTECQDANDVLTQLDFLTNVEAAPKFDLIVSDIRMPGFTGLEILEIANQLDEFPPVILITAFPDQETYEYAEKLGAAAMFSKPFDIHNLLEEIVQIEEIKVRAGNKKISRVNRKAVHIKFPLDMCFPHKSTTDLIKTFVKISSTKLNRFADSIEHCCVVVDHSGSLYHKTFRFQVTIDLTMTLKSIMVKRDLRWGIKYNDVFNAITSAFGIAYSEVAAHLRQLDPNLFMEKELFNGN